MCKRLFCGKVLEIRMVRKYLCLVGTALDVTDCPAYFIGTFLFRLPVPFPSVTPGRFAHRLLSYLWTALAFSRDFHTIPYASPLSLRSPSIVFSSFQ